MQVLVFVGISIDIYSRLVLLFMYQCAGVSDASNLL